MTFMAFIYIAQGMTVVRRCGDYVIVGDILGWSTSGKHIEEVTENVMKKLSGMWSFFAIGFRSINY